MASSRLTSATSKCSRYVPRYWMQRVGMPQARVAAPKARETDAEPAEKSEPQPGGEAQTPTDAIPQKLK